MPFLLNLTGGGASGTSCEIAVLLDDPWCNSREIFFGPVDLVGLRIVGDTEEASTKESKNFSR